MTDTEAAKRIGTRITPQRVESSPLLPDFAASSLRATAGSPWLQRKCPRHVRSLLVAVEEAGFGEDLVVLFLGADAGGVRCVEGSAGGAVDAGAVAPPSVAGL